MERYEIAIIGTGPAGLEAAITAKVRNKSIILFGSATLSPKLSVISHPIYNYLGLSGFTGKQMTEAFLTHLKDAGITIDERRVTGVYAMGDYFLLQINDNTVEEASCVILACGVVSGKPYPGEERLLGKGVSYCATCDGPLYKEKDVIVIGADPEEEKEAAYLAEICKDVKYFPLYKKPPAFPDKITVINEKPVEICGDKRVSSFKTDRNEYLCSAVFVLRAAQFPDQLVPGLETDAEGVITDRRMATNIPGLFAAGDITGRPYQFIRAAGQGNVAALAAVDYLADMKKE